MRSLRSDAGDLKWDRNVARIYDELQQLSDGPPGLKDPLHVLYAFMNVLVPPSPPQVILSHFVPPLDVPKLSAPRISIELEPRQSQDQNMITEEIGAHACTQRSHHSTPSPSRGCAGPGPLEAEAAGLASDAISSPSCASRQSPPPLEAESSCAVSPASSASYAFFEG